ncbi:MAG: RluA family pseudouridine synthase [Solobacterium sp.]|nr:RluA family pseudouridine synthase [Solobacterium sp.]
MAKLNWLVEEDIDLRIDKYLAKHSDLSRTRIQDLVSSGLVFVMDKPVKASYKVQLGDEIQCEVPEDIDLEVKAEDIPLDILYEDEDIIVINKPKGMVVHPAAGNQSGTLVNALLYHCKDLSGINGVIRPGIVHRIDKDTTGCIVACKNDHSHHEIANQLANKTCKRTYVGIVKGVIPHNDGIVDAPIARDTRDRQKMAVTDKNARNAITHFHVLERFSKATYMQFQLETGRTHQIRVHMKYINHPLLGDEKYGKKSKVFETQGQVLHASELELIHPTTKKPMHFYAPIPEYFENILEALRKDNACEID